MMDIDTLRLMALPCSTAQVRLDDLCEAYRFARGEVRREITTQIRTLVRLYPVLLDSLPDNVWASVYRVRSVGTVAPVFNKSETTS
jgi:hypothetical protein